MRAACGAHAYTGSMDEQYRLTIIRRVGVLSIIANVLLLGVKAAAAFLTGSRSMAGDFVHTLSDVATTVVMLIGCAMAAKRADEAHPYGHEKLEYVAAILLGAALAFTGLEVARGGVTSLRTGGAPIERGKLALLAAALSIAVKEGMFWITRHYAVKTGSGALKADAWHHRSDALSSVGSLAGVWCAVAGYPRGDGVGAIAIGGMIVLAGAGVAYRAAAHVDDHAAWDAPLSVMLSAASDVDGVIEARVVRTRMHGGVFYAEMIVRVDAAQTVAQAYAVARAVHDTVEARVPECKHITVNVEPHVADASEH